MKPGVSFDSRTGTLYSVKPEETRVLRGWPHVVALRLVPEQPPAYFRPRFLIPAGDIVSQIEALEAPPARRRQILLSFMVPWRERLRSRAEIAWLRWCQRIPTEVHELLTGFHRNHWDLLVFLARCGRPAMDLARTSPALAFALVHSPRFRKESRSRNESAGATLRAAQELLGPGRKQREILGWLGFPETETARRLVAKVPPCLASVAFLLRLRRALGDPGMVKTMERLPRLNVGVLRILVDPALRDRADRRLLREVAESHAEDRHAATANLLRQTLELADRFLPGMRTQRPLRSIAELTDIHRGLWAVAEDLGWDIDRVTFPDPPVVGTETIVPITSVTALIEESWVQRHCAGQYVRRVAREQDAYFYKVMEPERCTLMLAWDRGIWVAREIRRACNGAVSRATLCAVRDWLARMTGLPPDWSIASELHPD